MKLIGPFFNAVGFGIAVGVELEQAKHGAAACLIAFALIAAGIVIDMTTWR